MKNILSLKHFLILFLSATLISCAGDDDDDANGGRTTDPIIGTWRVDYDEDNSYSIVTFNSNGNYSGSYTDPDYPEDNSELNGTWSNSGTDFTSTRQTYTTIYLNEDGEQESDIENVIFSEGFNSFSFEDDEDVWIRQ